MSSTDDFTANLGSDNIRRYRTRLKATVYSHRSPDPIDVSPDVYACNVSKNMKGVGSCALSLVTSQNYLNKIFPNDYINIYFDVSDGNGWTRTFFGYVDRIEETYEVDSSGAPKTFYHLMCSDFTKAFEKIQIYFNPHIAGRSDLGGDFIGAPNIGGLAMFMRGVVLTDTPADVVTSILMMMLANNTQYVLPSSLKPLGADALRQQRMGLIREMLAPELREKILDFASLQNEIQAIRLTTTQNLSSLEGLSQQDRLALISETTGVSADIVNRRIPSTLDSTQALEIATALATTQTLFGAQDAGRQSELSSRFTSLVHSIVSPSRTLLDVVDLLTFVERDSIDGYIDGAPVYQGSDSLLGLAQSFSNEPINELFFDLRPVTETDSGFAEGPYSRDLDDTGDNAGDENTVQGVKYTPALVMREYPFSTISQIPTNGLVVNYASTGFRGPEARTLDDIYTGAIFSDKPTVPGRHITSIPTLNLKMLAEGLGSSFASKHLDVAVLRDSEITRTTFGRSDSDVFNLFEFYATGMGGNSAVYQTSEVIPIITPISIAQHGLRVRSLSTRYANFGLLGRNKPTTPQPVEATAAVPGTIVSPTIARFPVDRVIYQDKNTYKYRLRTARALGNRGLNGEGPAILPANTGVWIFHNGIDFGGGRGTEIKAVKAGIVVAAIVQGTIGFAGYGNCLIIQHDDGFFSLYAHLEGFNLPGLPADESKEVRTGSAFRGTLNIPNVAQGQVVGYMGDSDSPGAVHLHFEVLRRTNGRGMFYPSKNKTAAPDLLASAVGGEPSPIEDNPRNINPFDYIGSDVPAASGLAEEYPDDAGDLFISEAENGTDDPDATSPNTPVRRVRDTTDNPSSRRQVIRWALLQDLWYQHNIEYLAGTIECRPAPEIRVGYRLDLLDRNMSFYVEGMSHSWTYPNRMTTNVNVTRGQPNNPFPVYVLPAIANFTTSEDQRRANSRLANYFEVPDPSGVKTGISYHGEQNSPRYRDFAVTNTVDTEEGLAATNSTEAVVYPTIQSSSLIDYLLQLTSSPFADVETAVEAEDAAHTARVAGGESATVTPYIPAGVFSDSSVGPPAQIENQAQQTANGRVPR